MKFVKILSLKITTILGCIVLVTQAGALSTRDQIVQENINISKEIDRLAQELDTLLSGRKGNPKNKTTIRLLGFTENREGGFFEQSGHISIQLRLPKLEKNWRLSLSSFDPEDEFEGNQRNRDGARPQSQKLGTSVGVAKNIGKIETLFRPRVELRNPLVTSFLLRFRRQFNTSFGSFEWRKKFFVHSVDGAGQSLQLNLDNQLAPYMVLRFFTEGQYLDRDNFFAVSQGPSLRIRMGQDMALSNTLSINSANRILARDAQSALISADSYHLNNYRYILSFTHQILRRVFHYQLSPYLEFPKTNSFKGITGVTLQTEIIF